MDCCNPMANRNVDTSFAASQAAPLGANGLYAKISRLNALLCDDDGRTADCIVMSPHGVCLSPLLTGENTWPHFLRLSGFDSKARTQKTRWRFVITTQMRRSPAKQCAITCGSAW